MANLYPTPIYTNATDVRDTSTVDFSAVSDGEIDALIVQSQYIIDSYILCYWEKAVVDQSFIFPVLDTDWVTPIIPLDIQLASVAIVEQLFLEWWVTFEPEFEVLEEKSWPDSVKYGWTKTQKYITDKVKLYLEKYTVVFIKQGL